jgi:hypothetical protein
MMLTTLRSRSASLRRQIAARALMLSRSPGCAQRSFATARSNTLTLVAVNDVYDLEHLPKLRTLVDTVKAERAGGTVITTLAGDFLSPSVLSSLDRGRGMVQVLNAVGVDYACFGNHEADVGLKALRKRLGEFDATLINSNVPGAVDGAPATAVVDLPGGKRVGLLGLLTSEPGVFRKDVRTRRLSMAPSAHRFSPPAGLSRARDRRRTHNRERIVGGAPRRRRGSCCCINTSIDRRGPRAVTRRLR